MDNNMAFLDGVLSGLNIKHKNEDNTWFNPYKLMSMIASEWYDLSDESQRVISNTLLGDKID